jgi:hypothetical protein
MSLISPSRAIALALSCVATVAADELPCEPCVNDLCVVNDGPPSWIFAQSTFTHDPYTGARVAQYMRTPSIEPLDDQRMVTSRYNRNRTNLRGANGSFDTYYQIQQWGNGRGGIDAEWERFHDAWKESYLQGGYYNQGPGYGGGFPGYGYGGGFYGGPGHGNGYPGYGFPGGGWGGGPGWDGGPHGHGGKGGNHGGHGNGGKWDDGDDGD